MTRGVTVFHCDASGGCSINSASAKGRIRPQHIALDPGGLSYHAAPLPASAFHQDARFRPVLSDLTKSPQFALLPM